MTPAIATRSRSTLFVLMGAISLVTVSSALAQPAYSDGITVYGHRNHRVPDSVTELSRRVSYADLDLTSRDGQDELNWRIRQTAQVLCDKLGEGDEAGRNGSVLPTCQAAARDSAYGQVRRAVEAARYQASARYAAPPVYAAPVYETRYYQGPPQYRPAPQVDYRTETRSGAWTRTQTWVDER